MTTSRLHVLGALGFVASLVACGGGMSASTGGGAYTVARAPSGGSSGGYTMTAQSAPSVARVSAGGDVAATPTFRPAGMTAPTYAAASESRAEAAPSMASAGTGMGGGMTEMPAPPPAMPAGTAPATTIRLAITTPVPVQQQAVLVEQVAPAGLLTAASVGDVDRRDAFLEYLMRHPDEQATLGVDVSRRVRFRVMDNDQHPVNDAVITLQGEGMTVAGRTHADGRWDFFASQDAPQSHGVVNARVEVRGQTVAHAQVQLPSQGDGQDVTFQLDGQVSSGGGVRVLDLGFMIDVTGSMGDELRYVNGEISNIVRRIEAAAPGIQVRVGATFYRDRVDAQPLQMIPFTTNVAGFAGVMSSIRASGGGDYPEDMNAGFDAAMHRMQWSSGNADRILVVIADAPPQQYADEQYDYRAAMRDASSRGIRVLPVAASGSDRRVEYLFRSLGAYTSTPYTYLTDESGVGAPHMEADTDRVAVERFNDLLVRMVISDLRGEGMHEPGPLGPRG